MRGRWSFPSSGTHLLDVQPCVHSLACCCCPHSQWGRLRKLPQGHCWLLYSLTLLLLICVQVPNIGDMLLCRQEPNIHSLTLGKQEYLRVHPPSLQALKFQDPTRRFWTKGHTREWVVCRTTQAPFQQGITATDFARGSGAHTLSGRTEVLREVCATNGS